MLKVTALSTRPQLFTTLLIFFQQVGTEGISIESKSISIDAGESIYIEAG